MFDATREEEEKNAEKKYRSDVNAYLLKRSRQFGFPISYIGDDPDSPGCHICIVSGTRHQHDLKMDKALEGRPNGLFAMGRALINSIRNKFSNTFKGGK